MVEEKNGMTICLVKNLKKATLGFQSVNSNGKVLTNNYHFTPIVLTKT